MTSAQTAIRRLTLAAAFTLGLAAAPPLRAQDVDSRWLPWMGCWEPVAEEATGDLLCVRPAGAGVEVTELSAGIVRTRQTLVADGRAYPITADGCQGSRSAEFSTDGRRIYTITEQACDGDRPLTSTGLIAMVSPSEWIDAQAAQEDGEALGWARRYQPARADAAADAGFGDVAGDRDAPARRARTAAAAAVDVDDVIEATRTVAPEAVRTWIAELQDPFDLDRTRLLRLADAGVPANVIDVMVAVSYPDRFALDRDGDIERLAMQGDDRGGARRGYGRRRGFFGPVYFDPFYADRYGYGNGYGYGYGYGGGYYAPGVIIVVPRRDPEPDARVVRGRGYTRGNGNNNNNGGAPAAREPRREPDPPAPEPQPEPRRAKPRGG